MPTSVSSDGAWEPPQTFPVLFTPTALLGTLRSRRHSRRERLSEFRVIVRSYVCSVVHSGLSAAGTINSDSLSVSKPLRPETLLSEPV